MISLLDVNVLFALNWPSHVLHLEAKSWFNNARQDGWATCLITEAGFVRISCNPTVVGRQVMPSEAIQMLSTFTTDPFHTFVPLDRPLAEIPAEIQDRLSGYRQITDAMLLSTAVQNDCQLATFDEGLADLLPPAMRESVHLIRG